MITGTVYFYEGTLPSMHVYISQIVHLVCVLDILIYSWSVQTEVLMGPLPLNLDLNSPGLSLCLFLVKFQYFNQLKGSQTSTHAVQDVGDIFLTGLERSRPWNPMYWCLQWYSGEPQCASTFWGCHDKSDKNFAMERRSSNETSRLQQLTVSSWH